MRTATPGRWLRVSHNHLMDTDPAFSRQQARRIVDELGIDWNALRFDVDQFRMGLAVELEHGRRDAETNVSDDDELTTGKIGRAHLNEFPDYYTRKPNGGQSRTLLGPAGGS